MGRRPLVAALALGLVAPAGAAWAQAAERESPPKAEEKAAQGPASDGSRASKEEGANLEKRLERIRSERSGSLGAVRLVDPGARIAPAVGLERQEIGLPPPEPRLTRAESLPELTAEEKEQMFDTRLWRQRFAGLRRCPGEVALNRTVRLREVPAAGRILLRWTLDREGRVRDQAVVAAGGRIDPDVLTCVHRKMAGWQVVPPPETPHRADFTLHLNSGR